LQKKNVNDVKLLTLELTLFIELHHSQYKTEQRPVPPQISITGARTAALPRSAAFEDHT
jgi:hypothetical protein